MQGAIHVSFRQFKAGNWFPKPKMQLCCDYQANFFERKPQNLNAIATIAAIFNHFGPLIIENLALRVALTLVQWTPGIGEVCNPAGSCYLGKKGVPAGVGMGGESGCVITYP